MAIPLLPSSSSLWRATFIQLNWLLNVSRLGRHRKHRSSVAVQLFPWGHVFWYICLLRIWYLATDVVPLFVSRPSPRNECCFRAIL
jgi:hypothetical protein